MKKFITRSFVALIISCLALSCSSSQEETKKDTQLDYNENERINKNRVAPGTEKEIGIEKSDGTFEITANVSELKDIFTNQLLRDNITTTLESIEIKKDTLEGTNDIYYYLIGTNVDGTVKIATELYKSGSRLSASMQAASLSFTSTCTCYGTCTKGCDPRHYTDHEGMIAWRCSSCAQNGKTCNKSVTDSD